MLEVPKWNVFGVGVTQLVTSTRYTTYMGTSIIVHRKDYVAMKKTKPEEIGKRLLDARQKKDLSQQQVADRIGTTRNTISRYEQGVREPSCAVIVSLARIYGVSADYILGLGTKRIDISDLNDHDAQMIMTFIHTLRGKDRQIRELKELCRTEEDESNE